MSSGGREESRPARSARPGRPDTDVDAVLKQRWDTAHPIKYDGTNFKVWQDSLEGIFKLRQAGWMISDSNSAGDVLNDIGMTILNQALSESHKHLIKDKKVFSDAYNCIVAHYKTECKARAGILRRKLHTRAMTTDETAAAYLTDLNTMREQYQQIGGEMDDAALLEIAIDGLTERFQSVISQHCLTPYKSLAALQGALSQIESRTETHQLPSGFAQYVDRRPGRVKVFGWKELLHRCCAWLIYKQCLLTQAMHPRSKVTVAISDHIGVDESHALTLPLTPMSAMNNAGKNLLIRENPRHGHHALSFVTAGCSTTVPQPAPAAGGCYHSTLGLMGNFVDLRSRTYCPSHI